MAQRLVRRLCVHCRVPYEASEQELREVGLDPAQGATRQIYKPSAGCQHCQNGYSGRTGIHELLLINDEVRSLILQRLDSGTIKNAAQKHGFETLRIDGARKALEGITSLEEVLMVTHEESN